MRSFKEEIFPAKHRMVTYGQRTNEVYYVARGTLVEKYGELDDIDVNKIVFKRGRLACLHNLIPDEDSLMKSISDTYVHQGGVASVIKLDVKLL